VWGKQAENCKEYLSKGSLVFVLGRIENRSYDDKEGNKRYVSEVVASDVKFLSGKGEAPAGETGESGDDENLPF
jgi:single-strand DNA-binding protein